MLTMRGKYINLFREEVVEVETNIISNLIINRVNAASTIYTEVNTKAKRTNRSCWAIVFKFEGETVYTVNGEETVSNNGNVVILPKGLSYEWVCREAGHCAIVDFEGDVPGATARDCGNYLLMNLPEAQWEARKYLEEVLLFATDENLVYPQ